MYKIILKHKKSFMTTDQKTDIFIISAPSGTGKTSLIKAFINKNNNIKYNICISHTTRKPRNQEINGKDYYFTSKKNFRKIIENNGFIEYTKIFNEYYGTSKNIFYNQLTYPYILEINYIGARKVKKYFSKKKCLSIFISPPSIKELYKRLMKRNQDSKKIILSKIKEAKTELSHVKEYDFIIQNKNFKDALERLTKILK